MRNLTTDHIHLLRSPFVLLRTSSMFLLPSSFFLLPSSFTQAAQSHPDGTLFCDHPYLTPSKNGTMCVLPGRIDVGRHLILTGGARGLREPYVRTRRRGRDERGTTERRQRGREGRGGENPPPPVLFVCLLCDVLWGARDALSIEY